MADEPKPADPAVIKTPDGWMSDVQRALALLLIGSVTFMIFVLTLRIMWSGDLATVGALLKELKDALVNMSLIALGFFFGNTMAKMAQDVGQQKVVEKLTGQPPAAGPVAPLPQPTVVVSWWSLMKPDEQAAIEARGDTDDKIKLIHKRLTSGTAEPPDIVALIAAGLLKPERITDFKTA